MSSVSYLDTTVLVALLFGDERGSAVLAQLKKSPRRCSHHLIEAELASACKREGVPLAAAHDALRRLEILYPRVDMRTYTERVLEEGGYLRGADLLHVSTALWLSADEPKSLTFMTLDSRQAEVIEKFGIKTPRF